MVLDMRVAEGVGFEPTVPAKVHRFSKPAHSTTLAPLHPTENHLAVSMGVNQVAGIDNCLATYVI